MKNYNILGLMSGSSIDGLDMAYCAFTIADSDPTTLKWQLMEAEMVPFSDVWRRRLQNLPRQNALTFAKTHMYFGYYMAELVNAFLEKHQLSPDYISSHGHTIFHDPEKMMTAQIGSGAALSGKTGFPVICDFRTTDIAMSGEGAPIAPIADTLLYPGYDFYLNLGGIANVSYVSPDRTIAFDIAPANQILNYLAKKAGQEEYDTNGAIAATGNVYSPLMAGLNELEYFSLPYPKTISNDWIRNYVMKIYNYFDIPTEDKLRTACTHLAVKNSRSTENDCRARKTRNKILQNNGYRWWRA